MRVGIATDHGGFALKEELIGWARNQRRAPGHGYTSTTLVLSNRVSGVSAW